MLTNFEANSKVARNIEQYQFSVENQIAVETEIQQMLESAPSIYSAHVSQRAKEAFETRLWENIQRHRHYRVRDQDDIASDRPGRKFHIQQFIRILNSLPRRKFILNPYSIRGMRGVSVARGGKEPRYIMALDDGIMPEWAKLELDGHGLPKKLVSRGWRSVILTLLGQGLITEPEMLERFGFAGGVSGGLFRKYLWELRNRKYADGEAWVDTNRVRPVEEGD